MVVLFALRPVARRLLSSYFEIPVGGLLANLGLSPNVITLLGLLVAGASAYLLAAGLLVAGGVVLIAQGLFDLLDGAVARATDRVTKFGGLLDSVVDRISEATVLVGLLVFYLGRESSTDRDVGAVLVVLVLAGSMMVSYVRARASGLRIDCEVGFMTRPERILVLSVGLIIGGLWWLPAVATALGVIAVLTAITTVQRVLHVRRELARMETRD